MLELSPESTLDYLRQRGLLPAGDARVRVLGWGVSNVVLRVSPASGDDFVIKQSREKLRTSADWHSRLDRIWREAEVQQTLAGMLPEGTVPRVLFEDRDNYLYGMQAVESDHVVWKAALLEGRTDRHVAVRAAETLARIHRQTAGDERLRERWSDNAVFDELRLDPFYRHAATKHPQIRDALQRLVDESLHTPVCLVLADFSPKNVLLTSRGIALVDFETAHFGDPAFDLGFFLSHLLLKTILHAAARERFLELAASFWQTCLDRMGPPICESLQESALARRTVRHLAGCLLARIDGKSPVDYLSEPQQQFARRFALALFADLPQRPEQVLEDLRSALAEGML